MDLNRREFVTSLTVAAVCGACMCEGAMAAEEGGEKAPAKPTRTKFDAGAAKDFKEGFTVLKEDKVLIHRKGNELRAITAVCTHKACAVNPTPAGTQLKCKCHGSTFSAEGKVEKAPAKVSLPRFGVKVEGGRLLVDKTKTFDETKWGDPGAVAKLEGTA